MVTAEDKWAKYKFRKDLKPEEKYFNRELSWLKFNTRVLEEASNPNHPLLERLNFLSICGSNLDEFFMVRVAGLSGQEASGMHVVSRDGMTPAEQLKAINDYSTTLMQGQQQCWRDLKQELANKGLKVISDKDVTKTDKKWLQEYFLNEVFQVLTPLAIDPAHPFPFIPNLGFSLILSLTRNSDQLHTAALIPVPNQVKRFIRLPDGPHNKEIRFIRLETLISLFLDQLFPNYTLDGLGAFRVTRDSEVEVEDEAEDLVRVFESALKRRRRGSVIRLKINHDMPKPLRKMIVKEMGCNESNVIEVDGILGICDLSQLIVKDRPDLQFPSYSPRLPERIKEFGGDIFATIKAKDLIVHHPYETFDVVHSFLMQAAADPNVIAIKQTLYRAGEQSPIVNALIEAAEAGKSVTAVVELKARFDEAQNIKWARDLERAGVQVVFGFLEMKTHAKLSIVVRKENDGIKTYCHFGTGNYHPIKARIYTDLSFFTDDQKLGRDAAKIFNYITGYVAPSTMEKLSMSPFGIRNRLMSLIDSEIKNAKKGLPAAIWAKMNALVDAAIIDKLYEASCAGVQIELIVRGICCLKPQVKGLSENIYVKSIVGRFLEHSRIICFANGHDMSPENGLVFISSADWMPRNFNYRVEALVPVENATVKEQVMGQIMGANIRDNLQSWELDANGSYLRVIKNEEEEAFSAHQYFMTNPSLSGRGAALENWAPERHLVPKGRKKAVQKNS